MAVAFVDFKKAFDSVCHAVLETKLEREFGIRGPLLDWLKSYLKGRQQVTIVNGVPSGILPVSYGIPQGSVLGPTLFSMFTNDLPTSVVSGLVYMFADDTTIYCIGTSADEATAQLNLAMHELYSWCLANKLTPHPGKSEAMLISRKTPIGPISPIFIGGHTIKWVIKTRLLGMTVDHKPSWVPHTLELKKSFVNKLCLLKKLRFLPRIMSQDFYLRVIFPSVNYDLILWGSCCNSVHLDFLERLHCRAARIIFNLPKDMASHGVLERAEWFTIRFYYKLAIFKCMHKAYNGRLPSTLTYCIAKKRNLSYSIRARDSLLVPRFNTCFTKESIAYRGTVLWNMLSSRYTDLADTSLCNLVKKLKTSDLFKATKFNVLSASTASFEHDNFVYN